MLPGVFQSRLLATQKVEECKWMFRQGAQGTDPEAIREDYQMALRVMQDIQRGQYPPFPMFYSN